MSQLSRVLVATVLVSSMVHAATPTFNKNTPLAILSTAKNNVLCVHDPRESSNAIVFFDNTFNVSRDIKWMYSIGKKHDTFYDLSSAIGHTFMRVLRGLGRRAEYNGTPVIDEYNKKIPMYWFFSDQKKAHTFLDGLRDAFAQNGEVLADASSHPLFIEFKDGDELSPEDLEFVQQYFTLHTSLSSKKQKEFIDFVAESRRYIWETNAMTEAAKPELIGFYGNNIAERTFEEALYVTTKHLKELSIEKIASWILIGYLLKEGGLGKLSPKTLVEITRNGASKLAEYVGYGDAAPQTT